MSSIYEAAEAEAWLWREQQYPTTSNYYMLIKNTLYIFAYIMKIAFILHYECVHTIQRLKVTFQDVVFM